VTPDLLSAITGVVGEAHVSRRDSDRLVYSVDASWLPQMTLDRGVATPRPDVIVHPGSAAEVAAILALAHEARVPVVPWGGGSGTQGGTLPIHHGIVLDLKRLDQILEIDETSLSVRAQAGINGAVLEWALNERGLTLPHYPASAQCATLGGYLAPRGSGTISTKYGKA
jgi:alkyldihydroxyacetonephosphate synthase